MQKRLRIAGSLAIIFSIPNIVVHLSRIAPQFVLAGMTVIYGLVLWAGIELLQRKRWAWWYLTIVSLLSTIMGLATLRSFSLASIPTVLFTAVWIVLLALLLAAPPSRWTEMPTKMERE
ncbi:MAG: hypothetical protein ACYDBB_22990 [Armatimonadota bacterium]